MPNRTILVLGDVSVDRRAVATRRRADDPPTPGANNWEQHDGLRIYDMPGGAWFAASCIRTALRDPPKVSYKIKNAGFGYASFEGLQLKEAVIEFTGGQLEVGFNAGNNGKIPPYKLESGKIYINTKRPAGVTPTGQCDIVIVAKNPQMIEFVLQDIDPDNSNSAVLSGKLDIKCTKLCVEGDVLLDVQGVSGTIGNASIGVISAHSDVKEVWVNGAALLMPDHVSLKNATATNANITEAAFARARFDGKTKIEQVIEMPSGGARGAEVVTYPSLKDILDDPVKRAQIVHSWAELEYFPSRTEDKKNKVYRIKTLRGFDGPPNEQIHRKIRGALPYFLSHPTLKENIKPDVVVIEDQGNGYRDNVYCLEQLKKFLAQAQVVIYKVTKSLPPAESPFWQLIQKHQDRVIVIISADSLREMGVKISQGLSWEKTGEDLSKAVANNLVLKRFYTFRHLIVRLCLSAAYHYTASEQWLYYDPQQIEKSFANDQQHGAMTGHNSVIVASIVHHILKSYPVLFDSTTPPEPSTAEIASIGEGLRHGIVACREYYLAGLGRTREELHNLGKPKLPNERIFGANHDWAAATDLDPNRNHPDDFKKFGFLLDAFRGQTESAVFQFAEQIVTRGISLALADGKFRSGAPIPKFPVVWFGGSLTVVDRQEIEGYRAISSLIREYSDKINPPRPLSLAVFGAPGAGKSFGVKKIAESVLAHNRVVFVEQNLSQFTSPDELADVFHKVRDITLDTSKLPVVFFDEFDAALGGNKLEWLKFFLAPMQDNRFKYKQSTLGIGKSIFVFAGGTASTYSEFTEPMKGRASGTDVPTPAYLQFQSVKGPDFVSRLRGHVNIIGINALIPQDDHTSRALGNLSVSKLDPGVADAVKDHLYLIRRAVLLRAFLEKLGPDLFDDNETARIDKGVIQAFLKTKEYIHGPRSMEAILEMSALSRKKVFHKSSLPREELLDMHVHHGDFVNLLSI